MQELHYILQYELFNELSYADRLEFCTALQNPGLYEEYIKNLFDIIRPMTKIGFYWDEPPDGPTYSDPFDEDFYCPRSFMLLGERLINPLEVDEYGRNYLMRLIISQRRKKSQKKAIIDYITVNGYNCHPELVDKTDMNALSWACRHGMDDVATKLLDVFGSKCWNDNPILCSKAYVFARDNEMEVAGRLMG